MGDADAEKYIIGPSGEKRLKGVQLAVPVVTGNVSFSLGKKTMGDATHKWTVYLRSPTNEDLSHIIHKVEFELHQSFTNPKRDVLQQPFELTEAGWGEFDIVVKLHFHEDAMEPPLELYHHLMLGLDAQGNPPVKTVKPTVYELFEEIVFWEPTEAFYERVKNNVPTMAPISQLSQYFQRFDPATDYARIQNARKRLAPVTAGLKSQLDALLAREGGDGGVGTGGVVGMEMG